MMIVLEIMMASFIVALWVFFFFVFDDIILNGYFKKKLQKRFKVEE
jgi:hypothetical protein